MIKEIIDEIEKPALVVRQWCKGTRVRRLSGANRYTAGVVVDTQIARLINEHYGFGTFVIIGGNGESYSYPTQQDAIDQGWFLDTRTW